MKNLMSVLLPVLLISTHASAICPSYKSPDTSNGGYNVNTVTCQGSLQTADDMLAFINGVNNITVMHTSKTKGPVIVQKFDGGTYGVHCVAYARPDGTITLHNYVDNVSETNPQVCERHFGAKFKTLRVEKQ